MLFIINQEEMLTLQGLPYIYQLAYIYLRQAMNYNTGWVGKEDHRIAYSTLTQALRIEPGPGIRNAGRPSLANIRSAIGALARCGLLEADPSSNEEERRLSFYFPKATLAYSAAQNKVSRDCADGIQQKFDTAQSQENLENKPSLNEELLPINNEFNTEKIEEVNRLKRIKNINKKNIYSLRQVDPQGVVVHAKDFVAEEANQPQVTHTQLSWDFYPSDTTHTQAESLGIFNSRSACVIKHFIAHHSARGSVRADWNMEFLKWLIVNANYQITARKNQYAKPAKESLFPTKKTNEFDMAWEQETENIKKMRSMPMATRIERSRQDRIFKEIQE